MVSLLWRILRGEIEYRNLYLREVEILRRLLTSILIHLRITSILKVLRSLIQVTSRSLLELILGRLLALVLRWLLVLVLRWLLVLVLRWLLELVLLWVIERARILILYSNIDVNIVWHSVSRLTKATSRISKSRLIEWSLLYIWNKRNLWLIIRTINLMTHFIHFWCMNSCFFRKLLEIIVNLFITRHNAIEIKLESCIYLAIIYAKSIWLLSKEIYHSLTKFLHGV